MMIRILEQSLNSIYRSMVTKLYTPKMEWKALRNLKKQIIIYVF